MLKDSLPHFLLTTFIGFNAIGICIGIIIRKPGPCVIGDVIQTKLKVTANRPPGTGKDDDYTKALQNLVCDKLQSGSDNLPSKQIPPYHGQITKRITATEYELTLFYKYIIGTCTIGDSKCDDFMQTVLPANSQIFPIAFNSSVKIEKLDFSNPTHFYCGWSAAIEQELLACIRNPHHEIVKGITIELQDMNSNIIQNPPKGIGTVVERKLCQIISNTADFNEKMLYIKVHEIFDDTGTIMESLKADVYYPYLTDCIVYSCGSLLEHLAFRQITVNHLSIDYRVTITTPLIVFERDIESATINESEEINELIGKCL